MADCVLVTRSAPRRIVLTLCGEIDLMLATQLTDANAVIARTAPAAVHLDLQRVTFFSAGAVGFVATLLDQASRDHVELTIAPIPHCVRRAVRAADASLITHLEAGRELTDLRDARYGAQGGMWGALTASFSADERANISQTVTRTAQRERAASHYGNRHSG